MSAIIELVKKLRTTSRGREVTYGGNGKRVYIPVDGLSADAIEMLSEKPSCLNIEQEEEQCKHSDRIPIYIEATQQETTARVKLEGIADTGMSVAVLYDIPIKIKPFPMFTKVKILGKELEFYLGKDGNLVHKDCKPYDFWFGDN